MNDTANMALEAEQLVIGSLLQKPELLSVIDLDPGHFSSPVYEQAYRAFEDLRMAGIPIDMIDMMSVWSWLADKHPSDEWGPRLNTAQEAAYAPDNIELYADQVKRFASLRKLKQIGGRAFDATPGTVFEVADGIVSDLMQLEQTKISTECHIKQAVSAALEHIDQAFQQGGTLPGLTTGLIDLDEVIGGLQKGLLYIIAGRPGTGKTAIMITMAVNAARKEKVPIGIITMEQSNTQIAIRMLSGLSRIDSVSLSRGSLQEEEWPRLTKGSGIASGLDIWLDEKPAQSLAYIMRRAREWKYKYGIRALFVDYLQLVQTAEGRETRSEKLGAITKGLRALAKELKIAVISLAQLNRSLEDRSDKRPLLSDLRDSGEIEQDADTVMMLYRDEVYNEDSSDKGMAEIIVRKQRDGQLGMVRAAWLDQYCLFENYAPER
jgi:replicative DNA helicase